LSYTNGIGSPQQFPGAAEIAASSSASRTAKAEPGPAAEQEGFNWGPQADQATLSSTASAVAQALSAGDARSGKVADLQQTIMAGTYSVPATDVAAKVLSAMLQ
jgi:flagellar biosynthesis anti-sigma factor FlgM